MIRPNGAVNNERDVMGDFSLGLPSPCTRKLLAASLYVNCVININRWYHGNSVASGPAEKCGG